MLSLLVGIVIYAMAFALVASCYRHFSVKRNGSSEKRAFAGADTQKTENTLTKFSFLLLAVTLTFFVVTACEGTSRAADSQAAEAVS